MPVRPDAKHRNFRSSPSFRPFENLKALLESKSIPLASNPDNTIYAKPVVVDIKADPEHEHRLFMEAMADVKPLSDKKHIFSCSQTGEKQKNVASQSNSHYHPHESETLLQLSKLVTDGEGFVVSDTSEYMEGTGYCVNPEIIKRLHRGDFSIQAYIDLHGFGVRDAREAFEEFFKDALKTGKKAILIIHGRGLSSPAKPVLKTKVQKWLSSGPFRKWIIAFSSARNCDGGAGATYVLLRNRPVTKRYRKKRGKG